MSLLRNLYIYYNLDFAYDRIGNNLVCTNAALTSNRCDTWYRISEEDCKMKCSRNELAGSNCNKRECVYARYDMKSKNCYLRDKNCKVESDVTDTSWNTHTFKKFGK